MMSVSIEAAFCPAGSVFVRLHRRPLVDRYTTSSLVAASFVTTHRRPRVSTDTRGSECWVPPLSFTVKRCSRLDVAPAGAVASRPNVARASTARIGTDRLNMRALLLGGDDSSLLPYSSGEDASLSGCSTRLCA